jgi:PAS domain S-box-containing protein
LEFTLSLRILLIEDNPGDARLLQIMLRSAAGDAFRVEHTDRLSTGIALLQRTKYDALLLDLGLPDSQGIDTVKAVLRQCPTLPIIVLTGRDDDELAAQSVSVGAQDFIGKENLPSGTLVRALRHAIERGKIREKLRESEELFQLITENAGDLIAVVDPHGKRIYNSPSYQTILGYSPEELKGTSPFEQIHPDDHELVRNALAQARSNRTGGRIVYRMRHKNGSWRFLESTRSIIRNDEGEVTKLVSINRDITERKLLEEQFMQSQKMEAVGRLSGGIAHDFNNLLGVMIGYAEYLHEQLDGNNPLRGSADEILKAGKRAAALTRQLLAFSRQQVLDPKVLDINAIVSDIDQLLRRVIGEDIQLETELDALLGRVKADHSQIEQVLVNLAVNARDAMPNGGKLTIRTKSVDLDSASLQHHYPNQPGPYACLTVTDTGVGMDATTKARAFEPFFTTKEKGKGTGLGLSTVYGIVKQSGGHIHIESFPGEGTTFKIYLPLTLEVPATKATDSEPMHLRSGSETILIAEDEPSMRTLVRNILQACGYTVLEANDGEEALAISREYRGAVDLLLTDVIMPGMGGKALAQEIIRERPETAVVYMSGYTGHTYKEQWPLEPGCFLLMKPFTRHDLSRTVGLALESRFTIAGKEFE